MRLLGIPERLPEISCYLVRELVWQWQFKLGLDFRIFAYRTYCCAHVSHGGGGRQIFPRVKSLQIADQLRLQAQVEAAREDLDDPLVRGLRRSDVLLPVEAITLGKVGAREPRPDEWPLDGEVQVLVVTRRDEEIGGLIVPAERVVRVAAAPANSVV
jgi:hypothetical protein